jgi:hypothetical protein
VGGWVGACVVVMMMMAVVVVAVIMNVVVVVVLVVAVVDVYFTGLCSDQCAQLDSIFAV